MAKPEKVQNTPTKESDAFEMIELAINDISTLSRAFEVISEVCEEINDPHIVLSEPDSKVVVN